MPQLSQAFFLMSNPIQNFEWGSFDSMQQLFGFKNPEKLPQAELWMGAHANGCSGIVVKGIQTKLSDFIASSPEQILGLRAYQKFGELPYLFKVLAARSALSIQVHPSKEQAEIGYAKENQMGIDIGAAHRNYRDSNHKPELVYALTDYQALNGFRESQQIVDMFTALNNEVTNSLLADYKNNRDENGLRQFFVAMLELQGSQKDNAIDALLEFAKQHHANESYALVGKLAGHYPGDIGVFSPLFLNVLTLKPGQAMYLDACTPHAYVEGTGLEIMANSDNVLRAGLTPKHIDIKELSDCTRFVPIAQSSLLNQAISSPAGDEYQVPVPDFKFSIAQLDEGAKSVVSESAQIVFCIEGQCELGDEHGQRLSLKPGQSAFIPAYVSAFSMQGSGRIARAYN